MSKRIVHTETIKCGKETITFKYGPFEWFAHNCDYCHRWGTDIPFTDCHYKQPPGKVGNCCYRFCKLYKRRKLAGQGDS